MRRKTTIKLTKKQALEICKRLWEWLAENGNRDKDEWPEWDTLGTFENECPCCEYDGQQREAARARLVTTIYTCDNCPLMGIAWYSMCEDDCDGHSPYDGWKQGRTADDREFYAHQMVEHCETALAKFPKEDTDDDKA